MGNANGAANGGEEGSNQLNVARAASGDPMASSPPRDHPHQHRPPILFSSQAPSVPLPGKNNVHSIFSTMKQNEPSKSLDSQAVERGIPTIITWSFGGNSVAVEGSWDNYTTKKTLQRSGKDHSILLVLPSGIYHYRFIVDGQGRYATDLPRETDDMGHVCNLLDVHDYVPENLDSIAEFEVPPSPESSYDQAFPGDEEFAKDPMLVPPQLEGCKQLPPDGSKPQHVVLNHLFTEKGWSDQSVVSLGLTQRFRSKYVTVVLYKPLKK